jgi:murein DD-endopeptidase
VNTRFARIGLVFAMVAGIFAVSGWAQNAPAEKTFEGTWTGTLGGQLRLIVTINKASDGTLSGQLNSVDQHAVLRIEKASQDGNKVKFEVNRVGGLYEGKLNKDGSGISGTWTQTGTLPQPLDFKRAKTEETPKAGANAGASAGADVGAGAGANAGAGAGETKEHTPKPLVVPLDVVIPIAPTAFKADGKWHLIYELHAANLGKWDCAITRLDVVAGDSRGDRKALASFAGAELDGMVVHPGDVPKDSARIAPGEFAVIYMWVNFEKLEDVPASIGHSISTKIGDYPETLSVDTQLQAVERKPVVTIQPPLDGENWLAGNGPSNASLHRRALIAVNGRAWISQRFAIDWVELFPEGTTYHGDPSDNKNYRAYGAEIHAVAGGTVSEIKDGIPQNTPRAKSLAVPITLETVGGNHVIVDIGEGRYAFYAHMQPGSVRVKVGDRVQAGDVLGLVGNTGNSSEPHLHFDICNASSELACEGIPYAFASFEVQGQGWGWKSSESHGAPVAHEMEIPTEDEVVRFPPRR